LNDPFNANANKKGLESQKQEGNEEEKVENEIMSQPEEND